MKINNKGFTFVEILAVIVLIGILSSLAIVGVSRYRENAKNKDYEALARSSYNAMQEYMMSNPYEEGVSLETLEDNNFISNRKDPGTKESNCEGSVNVVKKNNTDGKLDDGEYTVYLCCTNYMKKYTYPDGKVEDMTSEEKSSKCNYTAPASTPEPDTPPSPDDPSVTCSPGNYLPKNTLSCKQCLSAYYCQGGTFKKKTIDQGMSPCPTGYKNSAVGSSKVSNCYMKVQTNKYVKKAKDTSSTACPSGQLKDAHNVNYGNISSCSTKTITVTFNCNGGTGGGSQTFKTGVSGNKFGKSCTRTGYTQDGWKKNKSATTRDYTTSNGVSDSWIITNSPKITLYAHWIINSYKCSAGYYLKKSGTSCTKCTASNYCPGGTYNYNTTKDQGISPCPTGYKNSAVGSSKVSNCYMKVEKNKYVKTAKASSATACPSGQLKDAHNVNYGSVSSCSAKTITVTFNCNGGSGGGNQTFKTGVSGNKFSKTCSMTGYTQDGWKKNKSATTRDYTTSNGVSDSWIISNEPKITLYAHWKINSYNCSAGYYLKKSGTSCTKCLANYYCPGGTYNYNTTKDQGINKCSEKAPGYAYSDAGSNATNDCYMKVSKNHYIKTAKAKTASACSSGTYKDAHNVNYGKVSSCTNKTITVTFNCNGGAGGGTQTFKSDATGQKFNKSCTKDGFTQDGWKKSKSATTRDYSTSSNVSENFIVTNSPKITLYAHWKMKAPDTPILVNPYGTNWTNKNINLTVSTTSPTTIIGKWYYSYTKDDGYKVLKDYNKNSSEGKKSFKTVAFTPEGNQYVYIKVCNKNTSNYKDTANCSKASKVIIKIDKTNPTLESQGTWNGCSASGYKSKEFGFKVTDNLSGFDLDKSSFQLVRYYDEACNSNSDAGWVHLNLKCSSNCIGDSAWLKSGGKSGSVDSGVLCGGHNLRFDYYMKICDLAGNCKEETIIDYTDQSVYC